MRVAPHSAVCCLMTATEGDSAVICPLDLAEGVLNVTEPGTITIADYAALATTLYGAFAA